MPMYINRVTSEVVVQPAAGLTQEQMQEIVKAVLKALEDKGRDSQDVQRATQIREKARAESSFE